MHGGMVYCTVISLVTHTAFFFPSSSPLRSALSLISLTLTPSLSLRPCDPGSLPLPSPERTPLPSPQNTLFLFRILSSHSPTMSGDTHALNPYPRGLLYNAATGVIAATFVCPLDVIKTRFQVGAPQLANGCVKGSVIVGSLEQKFHKEGIRGMYRGLAPTVLALLPNWVVYFTIYEQLKSLLCSGDESHHLSVGANMIAASAAGAATTFATNPLWVVKTRLQTQGMRPGVLPYRSTLFALRRITHEEGIWGYTVALYLLWLVSIM